MSENEELLLELEKTIDQLIEISFYLNTSFNRIFTEEELVNLRKNHNELMGQMKRVEEAYHSMGEDLSQEDVKRLDEKIEEFQQLNQCLLDRLGRNKS